MGEPIRASRAAALLRKPEQAERATFLELFFDLVFVFALTRVSQRLFNDVMSEGRIAAPEAGQTLLLLLALLMVWFATAWITDIYDPQSPVIQMVVTWAMFGSLVMAVAMPHAFGTRALVFAIAYVAVHVGRGVILVPALRGHEAQRRGAGVLLWFAISAIPWIAGGITADIAVRGALWTLAIAIEYIGAAMLYPAPWIRRQSPEWPVAGAYMAERYQQFFIVALGELILVIGVTYSADVFGVAGPTAAFVVAFLTTVLMWRIYVYRAGELLPAAFAAATAPTRLVGWALVAHMLMVSGAVVVAVGHEIVITHPSGSTEPAWIGAIIGGPILFLVGRSIFEYVVFSRVSRSRLIGTALLIGASPAMVLLPPLAVAAIAAAVLACIVKFDALRSRRRPPEPPSPPR